MKIDQDKLKAKILKSFQAEDKSEKEQNEIIARIEYLAHQDVLGALPELLGDVANSRISNIPEDNDEGFFAAIEMELTQAGIDYKELIAARIEDLCDEMQSDVDSLMKKLYDN